MSKLKPNLFKNTNLKRKFFPMRADMLLNRRVSKLANLRQLGKV